MWYAATVAAPVTEPVTSAQAKLQCRISSADTSFDTEITQLIAAARNYVEMRCTIRLGSRTDVPLLCDSFVDLQRFDESPVTAVSSIGYVDSDGEEQIVDAAVWELRTDDLEAAVVLKYGQSWPSIQPCSRITVTATIGYAPAPEVVAQAMLVHIADNFTQKENAVLDDWTVLDALLINHTRNA